MANLTQEQIDAIVAKATARSAQALSDARAREAAPPSARKRNLGGASATKSREIEEKGGFLGYLGDLVTDVTGGLPQMGDIDQNLIDAFNPAVTTDANLLPFKITPDFPQAMVGLLDTFKNRDERTGEIAPLTTLMTSTADTVAIGSLNKLGAFYDAQDQAGEEGFDEALAAATYQRALEQEEIRAANPVTAISGDIMGSFMTAVPIGGLAAGGAKLLGLGKPLIGTWLGRTAFSSAVAGGEAFAYRLNKDGDLEQATTDAAITMLGGIAINSILGGLGVGKRLFAKPSKTDALTQEVGEEIIRFINIDQMNNGLPPITASQVQAKLSQLGPDASLLDAYPALKTLMAGSMRAEGDEAASLVVRETLAARNNLMESVSKPDGLVSQVLGAQGVRGKAQFAADTKVLTDSLQPRYTAALREYADTRQSAKQLKEGITTLFAGGDRARWTSAQSDLHDALIKQITSFQENLPKMSGKGSKKVLGDDMTIEQMIDLSRTIADASSKKAIRVAGSDKVLPLDKTALRDLTTTGQYLKAQIARLTGGEFSEINKLNSLYGQFTSAQSAYAVGRKVMKPAGEVADIVRFLSSTKSPTSQAAFIEGAKYELLKKLRTATTPELMKKALLDNKDVINRLTALVGQGNVETMISSLEPALIKAQTADELLRVLPHGKAGDAGTAVTDIFNLARAAGGASNQVSSAAALGGLGSLLQRLTHPSAAAAPIKRGMQADILSKVGPEASATFKGLEDLINSQFSPDQARAFTKALGFGMGTGPSGVDSDMKVPR